MSYVKNARQCIGWDVLRDGTPKLFVLWEYGVRPEAGE
jgi:hypothetical protein